MEKFVHYLQKLIAKFKNSPDFKRTIEMYIDFESVEIKEDPYFVYVYYPYKDTMFDALARSIFPWKYSSKLKMYFYPFLIREEVYKTFKKPCPPKPPKINFIIDKPLSPWLYLHQIECIKLASIYPKYGFFLEMGLGKTMIICEILKLLKCKTLIVAPLSILDSVWIRHFKTFYPELLKNPQVINLYPYNKRQRDIIIKRHKGIHIINYDGFKINYETIFNDGNYKMLVIDESSKLKGRTTQIAKKLVEMARKTDIVYLLSGNPCPNSKMEIFVQTHAIAPGLLGWNYNQFRNRYFKRTKKFEWEFKKENEEEFYERIKRVCIFIKKEEVLDLPEKVFEERIIELEPMQMSYYEELKRFLATRIAGVKIITPTVLQQIMKLRQITSGFVYANNGEVVRFSKKKINELKEILKEIPPERKVIIWGHFKEEIDWIKEELGSSALKIYGDTPPHLRDPLIKTFRENEKYKYLVAHPQTLGHGVNLEFVNYAIYYSLDWSAELWSQSQDRIHRVGQKHNCTYISIIARDTIDEIIYARLQQKIEGSKELLEHLKRNKMF